MKLTLTSLWVWGCLCFHFWRCASEGTSTREAISARLESLRQIALSRPRATACNESRLVVITEYAWGNAGNQLISLTHGLWVAEQAGATLVVPHYMSAILFPFHLRVLREAFCFKEEWEYDDAATASLARQHGLSYTHIAPPPPKYRRKPFAAPAGSAVLEIESETCFFLFRFLAELRAGKVAGPVAALLPAWMRDPGAGPGQGPGMGRALDSVSEAFVRVYTGECVSVPSPLRSPHMSLYSPSEPFV